MAWLNQKKNKNKVNFFVFSFNQLSNKSVWYILYYYYFFIYFKHNSKTEKANKPLSQKMYPLFLSTLTNTIYLYLFFSSPLSNLLSVSKFFSFLLSFFALCLNYLRYLLSAIYLTKRKQSLRSFRFSSKRHDIAIKKPNRTGEWICVVVFCVYFLSTKKTKKRIINCNDENIH